MNTKNIFILLVMAALLWSCGSSKKVSKDSVSGGLLYNNAWELEYISGPQVTFDELFPSRKPTIVFNKSSKYVSGNNGCNGYSAEFFVKRNKISVGKSGPSTLMYCGDGEAIFLEAMQEINQYQLDREGKLVLMVGEIPLMRFKRKDENRQTMSEIYFRAHGTEPFWMLEISKNGIKMTTPEDSTFFPPVDAVQAMDANVKNYKTKHADNDLNILISQTPCTNKMTGVETLYSVHITSKSQKKPMDLKGCGEYITDYRLYDIWVLESLNGNKITKTDFSSEFPTLEINSNTNTFMGFAGCNSMNGNLFFEKELLRFTNIATTRMMCEPTNKEADFLLALRRSTTYIIDNNRLTLSNPDGETLVFKKID